MKKLIHPYLNLPRAIYLLIGAELFIQLINAAFTLLLNFYMQQEGYADYQITSMTGNRYLTVLLFSLPLALWSKGRSLKKIMLAGAALTPLVALLLLWSIHIHNDELIRLFMSCWGIGFSMVQVLAMPYTLLNSREDYRTESITLFFQTGIITTIIAGAISWLLINKLKFCNEGALLTAFSLLGFLAVWMIWKLPDEENKGEEVPFRNIGKDYDWERILNAVFPTFLIAFGAGFTIPFINLYFSIVHGMDSGAFSMMNAAAFSLVFFGNFMIPHLRRRLGYRFAITGIQAAAVLLLFLLGATEWYAPSATAYTVAVLAFVFRQPLMNVAGPMTSELTMEYVGRKNREIISALNAAIWSGSWFGSAKIFAVLRQSEVAYSNIIFITVILYIAGVIWYHRLIGLHEKEKAA